MDVFAARALAQDIADFIQRDSSAVHWAEFFNGDPTLLNDFKEHLSDAQVKSTIDSVRALIGRRVLKHAVHDKCTPIHKDLIRWHMDDFNEFLHDTNKREYQDRTAAENALADQAIDKIHSLLSSRDAGD